MKPNEADNRKAGEMGDAFPNEAKLKIGISSCLLGMKVRFDGGHKHDAYLTQTLGKYFDWISICPEMEIGMGAPRENVRLVGSINDPQLIAPKSQTDYTAKMKDFAAKRVEALANANLHGYILKKDSPTCGMERVRLYNRHNIPRREGIGIFARALMEKFPLLPIEEEGRLKDARLRENFLERVFAYRRLQEFLQANPDRGALVQFHTRHKLSLLSHSVEGYRELGRMVGNVSKENFQEVLDQYSQKFMEVLKERATTRKHTNVLFHVLGYFKKRLDARDRHELVELISRYRTGYVPLVVPLTLMKHHLPRHTIPWIESQFYFNPYPEELMLRNFI